MPLVWVFSNLYMTMFLLIMVLIYNLHLVALSQNSYVNNNNNLYIWCW